MASLQFLIDNMCAGFTVASMYALVRTRLAEGACTIGDIAHRVAEADRTLDIGSAKTLAEAAIEALAKSGDVVVQEAYIHAAG
ncbi:MAG: hypothetical protein HYY00_02505 [Chloroflexi bacterium]|nr:hypothetical protein [Chloroflexota bacterium]